MYLNSQLFTDGSARTYTLNSLLMALLFVFESLILVHAMDNTIEGLVALRRTKPCMSIEVFLLSVFYSLLHCKQFPLSDSMIEA